MNLVLFGAPGSGKGTQSELLIQKFGMTQISTGDLFRSAIKNNTNLGQEAKKFMDNGLLVPDKIVIAMVGEAISKVSGNFILDGFPRTVGQAQALNDLLVRLNLELGMVIFLDVPLLSLTERLTSRRVCKDCGSVYNIIQKPSIVEGVCDKCGGEVIQRPDDSIDVIGNRLMAYQEFTAPLKEFYKKIGKYVEVNGNRSTKEVFIEIEKIIK